MLSEKTAKLYAKFIVDDNGTPQYIEDNTQKKHYKIAICVFNAPKDPSQVTYFLNETYYNPIREKSNVDQKFEEVTASYGDYEIKAEILFRDPSRRQQGSIQRTSEKLSDMITSYYHDIQPEGLNSAVKEAIQYIERH